MATLIHLSTMRLKTTILLTAGLVASLSSCSDQNPDSEIPQAGGTIIATTEESAPGSRSCVDGDIDLSTGVLGLMWTDGDELGVFATSGAQVRYTKSNSDSERKAAFTPQGDAIAPRYAYYPYSAENDGRDLNSLIGSVPSEQSMDSGLLQGDYKIGRISATTSSGYEFVFKHLFSLLRVEVDATGTPLEGEALRSVELSLTRGGQPVAITGDFSFSARSGAVSMGSLTSSVLTMTWNEQAAVLSGAVKGFVSIFPNVRAGDVMDVTVTTEGHTARFATVAKVDFQEQGLYNFPILLKDRNADIAEVEGGNPSNSGTFTCATYNVDGLPSLVNSDGPGSSGTTTLGQRVNSDNLWDFFCVSEDFEYDSQLTSALTNYAYGTYRGSVGFSQTIGIKADTDGLNMFWKKNTGITVSNETFIEYNDKEGDLYHGANTCIKKGFRYYLVTLPDGTEIDVYITHMNTYSGSSIDESSNKYVAAVHSQLKQVRDYILTNMAKNLRPAIFMGDTNMRYTRHKLKEYFIDPINAMDGYSVVDPWVSLAWGYDFSSVGGTNYPLYGGKSLMVSDATGTNADTDVIISEADGGLQKGEIVDKIFYINCKDAKTQLSARSYLRDISYKKSDGSPLADHYPVVVEFGYTTR